MESKVAQEKCIDFLFISSDGRHAITANRGDREVEILDLMTTRVSSTIKLEAPIRHLEVNRAMNLMLVAHQEPIGVPGI